MHGDAMTDSEFKEQVVETLNEILEELRRLRIYLQTHEAA